ncbi:MAG: hypothetical protein A2X23_10375 [Chloroflexi bacterium GWC2_73_18]|nr:MAG: hypothetical protein A2X23_10375 [Chloroflexi bacterium GWC2_73_18]
MWSKRASAMLAVAVHRPLLGSYSSADRAVASSLGPPPATSTVPSGSSVAVWPPRAVVMLPVAVHRPLPGS